MYLRVNPLSSPCNSSHAIRMSFARAQQINGEVVKLTNAEWMDLIYPTNEDLPYMYDEFKWTHCR